MNREDLETLAAAEVDQLTATIRDMSDEERRWFIGSVLTTADDFAQRFVRVPFVSETASLLSVCAVLAAEACIQLGKNEPASEFVDQVRAAHDRILQAGAKE